jgi:hypothetical protein
MKATVVMALLGASVRHADGLVRVSGRSSALPLPTVTRQTFVTLAPVAAAIAAQSAFALPALASGGATAGRTTSIPTAKKRYFVRVTKDVKELLQMGDAITAGNLPSAFNAPFFQENGGLSDLTGAGYLLSVAFKIDGRIPPQKIKQKRDHDALIAALIKLQKQVGGSDAAAAKAQYAEALALLEVWLKGVELPTSAEL